MRLRRAKVSLTVKAALPSGARGQLRWPDDPPSPDARALHVERVFYTSGLMAGDVRAWRIIQLPASGQIFNVSQLVLPERAGMPDHEQQPMLPELDKLLEYARLQV